MPAKCMVVGDSVVGKVGAEHSDMMVECFPGIKTEQLHRVIEKRDLGSSETVVIDVGTNDLRTTGNLDSVTGEVYALVATAKRKLQNSRLVLSGELRCRDVPWRLIGALNDRFDLVGNALGITFVALKSWIQDGDFVRDGLHLMEEERDNLENHMLELVDWMWEDRQGVRSDKFWKMEIIEGGIPGRRGNHRSKKRKLYMKKMDQ